MIVGGTKSCAKEPALLERELLPIFTKNCLCCHGGLRQRGGLRRRNLLGAILAPPSSSRGQVVHPALDGQRSRSAVRIRSKPAGEIRSISPSAPDVHIVKPLPQLAPSMDELAIVSPAIGYITSSRFGLPEQDTSADFARLVRILHSSNGSLLRLSRNRIRETRGRLRGDYRITGTTLQLTS